MAGNTFGQLFKVTTFGESHGGAVGAVIDGCPPLLPLTAQDIQKELNRRKPNQSKITSARKEEDQINILSGVFEGKTTGAPILLLVYNKDARPQDYLTLKEIYRPGHADYTYEKKYGIRDWQGGGRSSARETLARVAAGAIAKKYLTTKLGVEIMAYTEEVGNLKAKVDFNKVTFEQIESNAIRCPDKLVADKMIDLIEKLKVQGDSIGGIIRGVIKNVPIGLGEPVFDKLPADLAKAMLSINAVKGFDIGGGFAESKLTGSCYNDSFYLDNKKQIKTKTNHAGGTLGGITNGENIYFRVVFKPVSTIAKWQKTLNREKRLTTFKASGRHDPCVLPRAVPIVEAMAALVIMDHYLRHKAQNL